MRARNVFLLLILALVQKPRAGIFGPGLGHFGNPKKVSQIWYHKNALILLITTVYNLIGFALVKLFRAGPN